MEPTRETRPVLPLVVAWATVAAAGLHTALGLLSGLAALQPERARSNPADAQAVAWFLAAGLGLLLIGLLGLRLVRATGRLPWEYGLLLLLTGAFVLVAARAWGGLLLVVIGALGLLAANRPRASREGAPGRVAEGRVD